MGQREKGDKESAVNTLNPHRGEVKHWIERTTIYTKTSKYASTYEQ